jgi:hypothetical protein
MCIVSSSKRCGGDDGPNYFQTRLLATRDCFDGIRNNFNCTHDGRNSHVIVDVIERQTVFEPQSKFRDGPV